MQSLINRQRCVLNVSDVLGSIPLTLIKGCGDVLKIKMNLKNGKYTLLLGGQTTFDMIMIPMSCTMLYLQSYLDNKAN